MEHVLTDEQIGDAIFSIIVGNDAGTITGMDREELGQLFREWLVHHEQFVIVPKTRLTALEAYANEGNALFALLQGIRTLVEDRRYP